MAEREALDVPHVDLVCREPVDVADFEFQSGLLADTLFDFLVKDVAFVLVEAFGKHADDSPAAVAVHREESDDRRARQADVERVVWGIPIDLDVGHVKQALECSAAEQKVEALADSAFW